MTVWRLVVLACAAMLAVPATGAAKQRTQRAVTVRSAEVLPSDRLTVRDGRQLTGRRVALERPDCAAAPSECADVDEINRLDGFSLSPRVSIPFSAPIDLDTVSERSVFVADRRGERIGLDRVVWTAATNTLHGEPDVALDQHTRYVLVVTDRVRGADGRRVRGRASGRVLRRVHRWTGVARRRVVAASVFTTQSITATLEKVRRQIDASVPAAASFALGAEGARTVFAFDEVRDVVWRRQTGTATFTTLPAAPAALPTVTGAIGTVAYGRFTSPQYLTEQRVIPSYPTRTGVPVQQRTEDLYFTLYLPAGAEPAGGWPVAIFGHGFTDSKEGAPRAVAATLAAAGIATVAINVVGHGGGAEGTLTVTRADGSAVTFPSGGRGIDQDGDGDIEATEGVNAAPPAQIVNNRDGLRQTTIDLMQLVRVIQRGVDVDGDARQDLDASRIGYAGQSFGGIYGTIFLAVEPDVRAGVPNVPGGPIPDVGRLGGFRPLTGAALLARTPSLYNATPDAALTNFDENLPMRDRPPLVDTVAGADAIQEFIARATWVQQSGDPVAYARHVRFDPLPGVPAKSVIVQFAKGDRTVPNPTTSALIRAGRLEDRTTYLRTDIARATLPGYAVTNPHSFITAVAPTQPESVRQVALQAQRQIATFLASGGGTVVDPDGAGPIFETPIAEPLPEELNFTP